MTDLLTGIIGGKQLCQGCFSDYLKILRNAGPRVGRVKARAPPGKVWFSYGESYVLFEELAGVWPCPSCEEFYETLYDVVIHYLQRHPEMANKANERITVKIDGKPVEVLKTAQGYLICPCGFVAENERHLANHYINSHRGMV